MCVGNYGFLKKSRTVLDSERRENDKVLLRWVSCSGVAMVF